MLCCVYVCGALLQGSWNLANVEFPSGTVINSWAFTTLMPPERLTPHGPTGTNTFLQVNEASPARLLRCLAAVVLTVLAWSQQHQLQSTDMRFMLPCCS